MASTIAVPDLISDVRRDYGRTRLTRGARFTPKSPKDAQMLVKLGLAHEAPKERGAESPKTPGGAPGRPPEKPIPPGHPHPEQPIVIPPGEKPEKPAKPEKPPEVPAEPGEIPEPKEAAKPMTLGSVRRGRTVQ